MFKKFDQLLASLGNMRAMERLHVDTVTEDSIINIEGDKIAESHEGQLFCGTSELNGYLFLETTILSSINIKTFDGAKLTFYNKQAEFILKSDTQEIVSDYSNVSNRFLTKISFDVTTEEIDRIRKGEFESLKLSWKKKSINLNKAFSPSSAAV